MARPISEQRPQFANWNDWDPDPCPDITRLDLWDSFNPWWRETFKDYKVDQERTNKLKDWDHIVRFQHNGTGNTRGGVPYQILEGNESRVRVWDSSRAGSWLPWNWNPFPSINVRLPSWVRRYGDPNPEYYGDYQHFHIEGNTYREFSAFGPSFLNFPHPWRAGNIVEWNLNRDWKNTRSSIVAGGFPMLPMLVTYDELTLGPGAMNKVLHLVAPHYSGEQIVNFARKTDGETPGHPLFAGDILRLREDYEPSDFATQDDLSIIWTLKNHGVCLDDKSSHQGRNARAIPFDSSVAGYGIRMAQDPRFDITLKLNISDFVVLERIN